MPSDPALAVLLVDDTPANLLAMSAALDGVGAQVVTASSAGEAFRRLLQRDFCAILMDVQMPVLDGFEAAAIIRQRARTATVPIIFVTAISQADEHVSRGYQLGAVDYLFKPVRAETLRAKVAVFVGIARDRALIEGQAAQLRLEVGERRLAEAALQETVAVLHATVDQLRIANEEARFANQELETFTSAVAHDLRAPLRGILDFSRTLLEDHRASLDDDGQDLLERIGTSSHWMGTLIDDLLHLSHCSHDAMISDVVDLSALASSCLAEIAREAPARQVIQRVTPGLVAVGDTRLLRIALDNLLRNAWKFSSKLPIATIEVGQDATGAFFVRDDGAGFDMAYASGLFGAFQRLHRQDEFEGNGIGLITVKRVIERHGGQLSAYAERDKGATFTFTLPAPPAVA